MYLMYYRFFFRRMVKISESVDDMVAFTRLTDNIIEHISFSQDPNLAEVCVI